MENNKCNEKNKNGEKGKTFYYYQMTEDNFKNKEDWPSCLTPTIFIPENMVVRVTNEGSNKTRFEDLNFDDYILHHDTNGTRLVSPEEFKKDYSI